MTESIKPQCDGGAVVASNRAHLGKARTGSYVTGLPRTDRLGDQSAVEHFVCHGRRNFVDELFS